MLTRAQHLSGAPVQMFYLRPMGECHAWWHTDRTPEVDPLAEDQAALETSRQRILATDDRVVPGHGEPFEAGRSS